MFIRNRFVINLVFFFICVFAFQKTSVAANLIQNGGFEYDKNNWDLTASTVSFSIVGDEIREGTKSARIAYSPTTLSNGIAQTTTSITPEHKYRLTVFAKSTSTTKKVFLRLRWHHGSGTTDVDSSILAEATDWTALEIISTAPLSVTKAEVRLHVSGGTGYFDEVNMGEYIEPSATPTLTPTTSPTPVPTLLPSSTPTPAPPLNYDNIFISEVMVAPESGQKEWVELYNANDFSVILTNWYVDDIPDGGSSPRLFSATILGRSMVVIDLTSSLLNNSGDSVRILDQNKSEKDRIDYDYSEQGKSWGRTDPTNTSSLCLQTPSKGTVNNPCLANEDSSSSTGASSKKAAQPTSKPKSSSSSSINSSSRQYRSTNTAQYKRYSISVTPPTLYSSGSNTSGLEVLGVSTKKSEDEPNYLLSDTLFFLSGSYSLLSLISIGIKLKLYFG